MSDDVKHLHNRIDQLEEYLRHRGMEPPPYPAPEVVEGANLNEVLWSLRARLAGAPESAVVRRVQDQLAGWSCAYGKLTKGMGHFICVTYEDFVLVPPEVVGEFSEEDAGTWAKQRANRPDIQERSHRLLCEFVMGRFMSGNARVRRVYTGARLTGVMVDRR